MFYIDSYNATYAHIEKAKSAAERLGGDLERWWPCDMTFLGYLSDKYRAPMQVWVEQGIIVPDQIEFSFRNLGDILEMKR